MTTLILKKVNQHALRFKQPLVRGFILPALNVDLETYEDHPWDRHFEFVARFHQRAVGFGSDYFDVVSYTVVRTKGTERWEVTMRVCRVTEEANHFKFWRETFGVKSDQDLARMVAGICSVSEVDKPGETFRKYFDGAPRSLWRDDSDSTRWIVEH